MKIGPAVMASLRWLLAARVLGQLVTWTITVVVIRLLDPQDYGLMALVMLVVGFAGLFNELGLGAALVQRNDVNQSLIEQVFGLLIVLNVVLCLLLALAAPLIGEFFDEPRMIALTAVAGLQLPIAALGAVPESMLARRMAFRRKSIVEFVSASVASFATLGFAITGAGVWALVYGSLVLAATRTLGMNVAAGLPGLPRFSVRGMRDVLTFGGYVTAERLLYYFYASSDVFIVGKLLGKDALGLYSIAEQLASLPNKKISGILNEVGFAAFSRVHTDMDELRRHFCKAVRLVSAISLPVAWGMSSVAPELVHVLLGPKWTEAAPLLLFISLVTPMWMISGVSTPALLGVGRPDVGLKALLTACAVMPVAFLIGSRWGVLGVAVAGLLAYPIVFAVRMRLILPILDVTARTYLAAFRGPTLAAGLMCACMAAVRGMIGPLPEAAVLAVLTVVGALAYVSTMRLTQRDAFRELVATLRS